ncbi:MAG: hypothetical protein B7Y02_02615 [Rhodobacterales bacterium 17-64-5]|nr:MAG: hypothetical protein B7Y02_02615 [Rhodobacterales bacterium 17-64-5]
MLFRQLLTAGDEIITEAPGWPQAGVMARAIGATLIEIPRDEGNGWSLDPDAIARAVTPRTRMIFLTNPNNPTGRLIPEADLRTLAALADRHGIWLVVDEVYAGLEWVGARQPSIAGLTPFGITTGSVSKALGLQGLRTGWMICQSAGVIRDAMILRENASEIMNTLGEHIAEIALRPDRLTAALTRARAEGAAALDRLDAFVSTEPRLSWHRPEAGLIGLARLEGEDGETLSRALLAAPWRTFLLPGSAYGLPRHIRLAAGGGPEARLDEIVRLHEAMGSMVFNPHRYTLEEGGRQSTDPGQLAFKRQADPKGILNPGKMIAWDAPDWTYDRMYSDPGMKAAE